MSSFMQLGGLAAVEDRLAAVQDIEARLASLEECAQLYQARWAGRTDSHCAGVGSEHPWRTCSAGSCLENTASWWQDWARWPSQGTTIKQTCRREDIFGLSRTEHPQLAQVGGAAV